MKKTLEFIYLLAMIFLFYACPDKENLDIITFSNESLDTIVYWASYSYPDTAINKIRGFENSGTYNNSIIKPKNTNQMGDEIRPFLKLNNKLFIFFFSKKVVDTTPWDTIRKNYLILKRYDLDLKTLDSLNWRVVYK